MDLVVQPWDLSLIPTGDRFWKRDLISSNGKYVRSVELIKESSSIYAEGRYDTEGLTSGCTYEVVFEVFLTNPLGVFTLNLCLEKNDIVLFNLRAENTPINQWTELPGLRFKASIGDILLFNLRAERVKGLILNPVKIRPAAPKPPPPDREDPGSSKPLFPNPWKHLHQQVDEETSMLLIPCQNLTLEPGGRSWKMVLAFSVEDEILHALQLVEDSMVSIDGWIDMAKLKPGCTYEAVIEVIMCMREEDEGELRFYGVHSSYIPRHTWVELDSFTFEAGGSQKRGFKFPHAKLVEGLILGGIRVRPVKKQGSENLQLRLWEMTFGSTGGDSGQWKAMSKYRDVERVDVVELIKAPGFLVWADVAVWKLIPGASYQVVLKIRRESASNAGWDSPLEFSLLLPDQSPRIKKLQLVNVPVDKWIALVVVDRLKVVPWSKITSSIGIAMRDTGKKLKKGLVIQGFLLRRIH